MVSILGTRTALRPWPATTIRSVLMAFFFCVNNNSLQFSINMSWIVLSECSDTRVCNPLGYAIPQKNMASFYSLCSVPQCWVPVLPTKNSSKLLGMVYENILPPYIVSRYSKPLRKQFNQKDFFYVSVSTVCVDKYMRLWRFCRTPHNKLNYMVNAYGRILMSPWLNKPSMPTPLSIRKRWKIVDWKHEEREFVT